MNRIFITKKFISNVLNKAHVKYSHLFDSLLHIKNFKREDFDGKRIIQFQYELALTLYNLAETRRLVTTEESSVIKRKKDYSPDWFRNRLKNISSYKKALNICIGMGKSLGDAFVWHFYMFNKSELFKHLEHEEIKIPPTGTGGIGELEFIKVGLKWQDHICLLHSNTSILRIGDVSFISIKDFKLSAIGEIKTQKNSDTEYTLNMSIIGEKGRELFNIEKVIPKKIKTDAKPKNQKNLRQLKKISSYIGYSPKNPLLKDVFDNYYTNELEKLIEDCRNKDFNIVKLDEGLLYVAVRTKAKSFANRFFGKEVKPDLEKIGPTLNDAVLSIINKNVPNFDIEFGRVLYNKDLIYSADLGTAPLFWYPIKASTLKQLYLQDYIVFTLYNPTFLFKKLKERGLDFIEEENTKRLFFGIKYMGGSIRLLRLKFFIDLIKNHLQTEDGIISAIEESIKTSKEQMDNGLHGIMNIETIQHFNVYNHD